VVVRVAWVRFLQMYLYAHLCMFDAYHLNHANDMNDTDDMSDTF